MSMMDKNNSINMKIISITLKSLACSRMNLIFPKKTNPKSKKILATIMKLLEVKEEDSRKLRISMTILYKIVI
jgi:hypothetical protein